MKRTIIFPITPQTHVRANQGDRVFFRIPRDQLRPAGLKRLKRLERYNEYKISISALSKKYKFTLPEQGCHIIFYIPVSKSWKKYKKEAMHMKLHQLKPDVDNLAKAIFDGLMMEDKHIADIRITKKWVNKEKGWIEFNCSTPTYASSDLLI